MQQELFIFISHNTWPKPRSLPKNFLPEWSFLTNLCEKSKGCKKTMHPFLYTHNWGSCMLLLDSVIATDTKI